jgi:K+-sensing histidine kinase KdpD
MLKRILVGLGGTEYSVAAINQAVSLAMAHDAELTDVMVSMQKQSASQDPPRNTRCRLCEIGERT